MPDSPQRRTIRSGRIKGGEPLSRANENFYELQIPKCVGEVYGLAKVISPTVRVRGSGRKYVYVRCVKCGREKWVMYSNIRRGISKGCRQCLQPKRFPTWFRRRVESARQRCTNAKHKAWKHYGGRGIEFRFNTVAEACLWLIENFGLPKKGMTLDRIDNDGHYEPGNLRYSTQRQNCSHTRKRPLAPMLHKFKMLYPRVRYADGTLLKFFKIGMTPAEIAARWNTKSDLVKNRCRSGIYSTPDPFIASQCKEF